MRRTIHAPGTELIEIDRSGQNVYENDVGTKCLVTGFAANGQDYVTKRIRTMSQFIEEYGYPVTEAERYFYNAAFEVIDKKGILFTAKLPYYNASLDRLPFCRYRVNQDLHQITSEVYTDYNSETQKDEPKLYPVIDNDGNPVRDDAGNIVYKTNIVPNDSLAALSMFVDPNITSYLTIEAVETPELSTFNYRESLAPEVIEEYNRVTKDFTDDDWNKPENAIWAEKRNEIKEATLLQAKRGTGTITFNQYDDLIVNKFNTLVRDNEFMIVDITRKKYSIDANYSYGDDQCTDLEYKTGNEYLGILPVVTTAANALYYQNLLLRRGVVSAVYDAYEYDDGSGRWHVEAEDVLSVKPEDYMPLAGLTTLSGVVKVTDAFLNSELFQNTAQNFTQYLGSTSFEDDTISKAAMSMFPEIPYIDKNRLDPAYLKQIGVVVFKMYSDASSSNRVGFEMVESFVGSLDKKYRSNYTKDIAFIDDVINNNSQYINFFSNVKFSTLGHYMALPCDVASTFYINKQTATSLGFYNIQYDKAINVDLIKRSLGVIFENCKNPLTFDIDLLIDAGVSNIAQTVYWQSGRSASSAAVYEPQSDEPIESDRIYRLNNSNVWNSIIQIYNNYCKNVRKDCMFLADGLRDLCIEADEKIIRKSAPKNSIEEKILPYVKCMLGINSSYGAGYCNWFFAPDVYSGIYYWVPPSIKAAGIYLYTDTYCKPWDAPAGLNRGVVDNVLDIAFNPTIEQAGKIYLNNWNYAISWPLDGITLEGQKTFQTNKTAFDRVNVRRLFLYLEKQVTRIARRFVYEGNTAYMRQHFVDTITPIFEDARLNDGILEYYILCDDTNNTVQSIENHELHCTIAVKPVKSIEFIVMRFICTTQSASVFEEAHRG